MNEMFEQSLFYYYYLTLYECVYLILNISFNNHGAASIFGVFEKLSSRSVSGWDIVEDIRPVDSRAEVASSADVTVRVMDEVIWLPASWGQVLTFGRLNGGLFDGLEGDTFDGGDSNKCKELEHF